MKQIVAALLLSVFLMVLAGCGQQSAQPIVSEEGITALTEAQTAPSAIPQEQVQCTALEKDGAVYGFEMRFRQSEDTDALLRAPENYYYGVLTCGKSTVSVPTEEIRILTDIQTKSFVVTLLLPKGETLSGGECTVSLCIAPREAAEKGVLFCVSKDVSLS